MKKIKPAETYHCTWCKDHALKVQATWRSSGISLNKQACDLHKPLLQDFERDNRDDGHMSEADEQTWGRL